VSAVKVVKQTASRITGVDFSAYEKMRASAGNRGIRMTYTDGVLWIMSPQFRHEIGARRLGALVLAYALTTKLECEAAGATTFKKGVPDQPTGKGKEGDETYYLGSLAAEVRNKESLDVSVEPPPSLWIEVDNYGDSRGKLPLYAALGVPEVWQYRVRRRALKFWRLEGGQYAEIPASLALPGLEAEMVLELLDESKRIGLTRWLQWLLTVWFPQNRARFPDFTNHQP